MYLVQETHSGKGLAKGHLSKRNLPEIPNGLNLTITVSNSLNANHSLSESLASKENHFSSELLNKHCLLSEMFNGITY